MLPARPAPCGGEEAQRLQGRPGSWCRGARGLKKQLKDLAADVLAGEVDRGRAAVANQLLNTYLRAAEQERKARELEEIAGRLEALEEVLKGRKAG